MFFFLNENKIILTSIKNTYTEKNLFAGTRIQIVANKLLFFFFGTIVNGIRNKEKLQKNWYLVDSHAPLVPYNT